MQLLQSILILGLLTLTRASRLYVSSYSGNITTIGLTEKTDGVDLNATSQSKGCAPSPSWLEYNSKTSTLYCADEGIPTPDKANFTSFRVETDSSLKLLDTITTLNGGVNTVTYTVGKQNFMAIAHYGGSGISLVNTTDPTALVLLKQYSFTFGTNLPAGSDPAKPAVPFVHQVVVDPTGKFLLAPDLSADMIHVFGFSDDGSLTDPPGQESLRVHQGSGPRHLVIYQPDGKKGRTYVYVVMEKLNTLHGYEVTYTATGTMEFKNVYMSTIFGGDELPAGAAAAEIKLTPDNKYLIISSRLDKLSPLNPNSPSDTLVTFSLDPQNGLPTLHQKFSAGGLGPRSFAINRAGDLVAVALNAQNKLVILKRDVNTGSFVKQLGSLDLDVGGEPGLVSSVIWAEDGDEAIAVGGGEAGGSSIAVSASNAPTSSAKESSAPASSSSGEDLTTTTTVLATATVTKSASQAIGSSSLNSISVLPTVTRTLSSASKSAISVAMPTSNTNPVQIAPVAMSAGSTAVTATIQTTQLTASHSGALSHPTPTRFSMTIPSNIGTENPSIYSQTGYFVTVAPGSFPDSAMSAPSPASNSTRFSRTTVGLTGTPTAVHADMVGKCKKFYEVMSGDECDIICTKMGVPRKAFVEWNPSVGSECTGLVAGDWVCVGL